jgi:phosphate transport system permease protein
MESVFKKLSLTSATLILLLLTSIFVVLFIYAKPAIDEFGLKFLTDPRWGVTVQVDTPKVDKQVATTEQVTDEMAQNDNSQTEDLLLDDSSDNSDSLLTDDEDGSTANTKEVYGGFVPIVGTVLSTILAMLFAVPIAMGIAVFLSEIAHPLLAKPVGVAIELLAAIPSIIYGMWGLFYFGPLVSKYVGGQSVSLLVAGLVLGVMIIPFMASLTRDSMNTTPAVLKESAYAMGATKFEVIKDVIFPYAKQGIIGSIILALGRALGETMAVAFVIGGVFTFPKVVTDPTVSIPVVLANSFAESSGMSMSALFYLAVVLFVLSFAVISFAKFYFLRDKNEIFNK